LLAVKDKESSGLKRYIKYISRLSFFTILISLVWGVSASIGLSPNDLQQGHYIAPPDSAGPDTTLRFPIPESKNPYDVAPSGGLYLKNPSNLKEDVTYDPKNNEYTITNKIGTLDYRNPASFSFDEYRKYDTRRALDSYWQERANSSSGATRLGVIPQLRVGGELFDRVFGGNTIDIKPQGSTELTFGVISNRRDDPFISQRLRRTTNFDFDMKIQMSLQAKIGDKIEFNTNYNTEATFDFENKLKLKYEGKEDEIIKLIEAGNINMPINSTLITGSQSLFGLKTQLQFGKATITSVFSQQQSQVQNITVQGGAQTQKFSTRALDYEENRHFFIGQYFRNEYEGALATLPVITSNINISKIEVWITNIGAAITENRNIIAFQDVGESNPYNSTINPTSQQRYPDNESNDLFHQIDTTKVRDINLASEYLISAKGFTPGIDFEKIESARKLSSSEFMYNSRLGFISLNTTINPDQTLAVAYQYTILGDSKVYQVGEFSDQGIPTKSCLMVKLLKSTATNTHVPLWNLMMKNVYNLGAYNVNSEDFLFNILYTGNSNAVPTGFFENAPTSIKGIPLIQVFGLDKLDQQLNPPHDGIFDFIDNAARNGGTIQASNGRVFFPVLEPFGSYLRTKLNDKVFADKYCYDSLYSMTKTGAQQYPDKNKYLMEGQYKSESGSDISLNAMNVPQGSVKVTAGGVQLAENVDYTVDYTLGRVKIINEGILNSGTPINIQLENNSMFNVYSQTLLGTHVDYKVNKDLLLGATILNLYERPITTKTNYGDEPINNTIWGASINYQKQSGLITKLLDKLPFYSTKVPSKLRVDAEFAQFIPGHSRAVGKTGTSYIDDFEGAKSTISLTNIASWSIASTPQGQTTTLMFPEAATGTHLAYGYNRAITAWYTIDPSVFYEKSNSRRPAGIDNDELSKNSVRAIYESELFPRKDNTYNNLPLNLNIFNLAYFPDERGPYNYDVNGKPGFSKGINAEGKLNDPTSRWGGIMRKMETSDFEAANVEYITFWLMDPFSESQTILGQQGGNLYFNLGDISEDILRDGRKSYENGLPTSEIITDVDTTDWGRVPTQQALTQSFDSKVESRQFQDVGYDGLRTVDEQTFFDKYLQDIITNIGAGSNAYVQADADPSSDNFHSFVGGDYDSDPSGKYNSVVERYKLYNGPDGNSPANTDNNSNNIGQRNPNVEDLNNDNTLSDQERYFQYVIHLKPGEMKVGTNYITDVIDSRGTVDLPKGGDKGGSLWYQFKIPVQQPDKVVGGIQDYKSIRFMRMFFKDWDTAVVCRFASFELERGEWRKYNNSLLTPGEYVPDPNQDGTTFDISTLSYEENFNRANVAYRTPPGIEREINAASTNYAQLNEQAMVLKTCNLLDGDARGAYKTTDFDFRNYKNLKMYVHGEKSIKEKDLQAGDLTAFVRFGSDFTTNYYEYEIPITFTEWADNWPDTPENQNLIWPEANIMDIELANLVAAKTARNNAMNSSESVITLVTPYTIADPNNPKNKITIVGSPSMSDVRTMLIGVRNPKRNPNKPGDDGQEKCAEIWINELRLTDFNEKSGWAANARLASNLADLGNVMISGAYSSAGFGSIEKKVNDRQKEAISQIDVATNLELGKFLPEKSGIRIPMHYDYSQTVSNPQYNPLDPDVLYSEQTKDMSKHEKDSLKQLTTDVTKRQNLNFMNVRKDRVGAAQKPQLWDIENLDLSYAYSEITHHNTDIESYKQKTYRGGLGYNFTVNPKNIKPFQKVVKSKSLAVIRDFNFYFLPKLLSFRTDMYRDYEKKLLRNKSAALIILEPNYTKHWDWNRIYDVKYDFSQSLKFDYSANVNAYIQEPAGGYEKQKSNYESYRDTVWNSIKNFGSTNKFNQSANINYTVPFNKIPILNWVTLNARYGSKYRWEASPISLQERFGNTIENSRDIQLNGGLRMSTLYDKVPFLKKARLELQSNSQSQPGRLPGRDMENPKGKEKDAKPEQAKKPGKNAANADSLDIPKKNYLKIIGNYSLGVLTSVKDVNFTYSKSNGIILPGFTPEPGPLGNSWNIDAPGLGFIFGSQKDIKYLAATSGWLTTDTLLNNPYITRSTENFTFRSTLEPVKNFKIDITADRAYATTYTAYFKANSSGNFQEPTAPQDRGNFSMSFIMLSTAFKKDNKDNQNPVFEQMLSYRKTMAERLASENPNSVGVDSLGFPNGYGPTQPQVMLAAFMAAYSGKDPNKVKFNAFPKIPYPNWRITYNASQGIAVLRKYFQSFNVSHAYRSSYSVGGFLTDITYGADADGFPAALDNARNFIPEKRMDVITVTEQFGPLIGIDVTMKNSMLARFEYKKTRNLSLSFVNNQLTEMRSNELVIGTGYRFKSVPFKVRSLATGKTVKMKSDLNIKLDFSIRDNKTILRRIEENNNQISTGTRATSINFSADYMVSQKLNVRLFYDQTINKPHVSAQIPTSNVNAGLSLRFTLAQ
jgi:cell surface protein SprA